MRTISRDSGDLTLNVLLTALQNKQIWGKWSMVILFIGACRPRFIRLALVGAEKAEMLAVPGTPELRVALHDLYTRRRYHGVHLLA